MSNVNIGNNLKKARKGKKLTLKELSNLSGLSVSFISDIENYRRSPSLETALKLSNVLDVNVNLFLNDTTINILEHNNPSKLDSSNEFIMLGDKIKNLRKEYKVTQQELSKVIGLGRSALGMVETNKNGLSAENLKKVATFFDVTVDYLLSDNEENTSNKSDDFNPALSIKEQEKLDSEAQKLIDDFTLSLSKNKDNLEDEDYEILKESMKTLLETMAIKNKQKYTPKKYRK